MKNQLIDLKFTIANKAPGLSIEYKTGLGIVVIIRPADWRNKLALQNVGLNGPRATYIQTAV